MKRTTLIRLSFPDDGALFNHGSASIERIGHLPLEACHALAQAALNERAPAIHRALASPDNDPSFVIGEAYDWAAALPPPKSSNL